jgi:hypothetical protein
MEADMLHESNAPASTREAGVTLVDRIHDAIADLAPAVAGGPDVWARRSGRHLLLGLQGDEAFARLTPLGGGLFGLSFRCVDDPGAWEPMLLIDALEAVVEHALVAVEALPIQ